MSIWHHRAAADSKAKLDANKEVTLTVRGSEVLAKETAGNLEELFLHLEAMSPDIFHRDEVLIFNKDGNPVTLRLIEDTLTDGSKVMNINIE